MMKKLAKYILGAGAAGVGALAAVILIPGLVGETTGQSAGAFVAPAQAESIQVAQAEQQPAATPSAAVTFQNGATTVQESYSDWQVSCGIRGDAKVCSMVQQQTNRETRQRVLAIELTAKGDMMEGALVLPFGILLENGVTLQVDEGAKGPALRFRTCVPNGCVVPLNFDAAFVSALTKGGTLKVNAVPDGREEIGFSISLRGFGAARSRVAELLG